MAITVSLPSSGVSLADLVDIIDFISVDAVVDTTSSTGFSGYGSFGGTAASFSVSGSGFGLGMIGGTYYVTSGVIDTITFTLGGQELLFASVDIDMKDFAPIIYRDEYGIDQSAIETFLMARDWDITLGNEDDIAGSGSTVGDGVAFNLIGNDRIAGGGGDDVLFAGDGNDRLFGDAGNDTLEGGAGRDKIFGGGGADKLYGDDGNDRLEGGNGNDKLFGGAGADVLIGGRGNDRMTGGAGLDTFVFGNKAGRDVITDFNATSNGEDIDLSAVTRIRNFKDLVNNHMEQVGSDVVIDDHAGTRITLLNVEIADLGKGDFLF
ncbi:calcium-binding protein [Pseudodonghicola sp.]|uniref:calcium-binding protein n=1 Tax=Pseudodonghicola sp. TaxID=1969463 RepID=UPI003A977719